MKKLAIILIGNDIDILLLAGTELALGKPGSCSCPSSMSCSQSGCVAACGGSSAQSDAGGVGATFACQSHCSHDRCGDTKVAVRPAAKATVSHSAVPLIIELIRARSLP